MNIPHRVIGHNHPRHTRMIVGLILMILGVLIAKLGPMICDSHSVHIIIETLGTLINGIGVTPFVEECL